MNISDLLSSLDSELARLEQARALLSGAGNGGRNDATVQRVKTRKWLMSDEARKRISDAQKKRWAKLKRAATEEA